MKSLFVICIEIIFLSVHITCPPVSKLENQDDIDLEKLFSGIDYASYLSEVMVELQKDIGFIGGISSANDSTSLSNALHLASERVRSKLDELKRIEVRRITTLQRELDRRRNGDSHPHEMPFPPTKPIDLSHIDDKNPESFSTEDLKRLIDKTTEIFNQIDKRNEDDYKFHEMEKEAQKKAEFEKIKDENQRKSEETKWHEAEIERRQKHKPIHEPGTVEHLKSVWSEEDKMDEAAFNPKTLFFLHDLNNDGYLDVAELETLFQKELDKAYDPENNETDLIERYHEMSRMRKTFLKHVDTDNNRMISLGEFLQWVRTDEYQQQKEWKTQEEFQPNYSKEEFESFYNDYINRHPEFHQPPITMPPTPPPNPPGTR